MVELLIVMATVAALAVIVILVLNPSQLLKQARDSTRLADLAALNKAIGISQTSLSSSGSGSTTTLYLSLADASSTCGSYALPALMQGRTYHCVPADSSTRVDGMGWIPLSFLTDSSVTAIHKLPVDPVNSASGDLYYRFMTGGTSWKVSARLESAKMASAAISDGGTDASLMELGSNLALIATQTGPPGNPLMWLAADGLAGASNGDTILTWTDLTGNGNDAVAVGAGPVYRANRVNGKPALEFTAASGQKMRAYPAVNLPYTIFVVGRMRGTQNGRLLGSVYPNNSNWLLGWWNGSQDAMYAEGFVVPGGTAATTNWIMYAGKGNGTQTAFYKNGSLLAQNANGVQGINGGLALSGYAPSSNEEVSDGDIAEIIVYPTALSDVDRAAVEAYLNARYALY